MTKTDKQRGELYKITIEKISKALKTKQSDDTKLSLIIVILEQCHKANRFSISELANDLSKD